jgi:hypothetical protein
LNIFQASKDHPVETLLSVSQSVAVSLPDSSVRLADADDLRDTRYTDDTVARTGLSAAWVFCHLGIYLIREILRKCLPSGDSVTSHGIVTLCFIGDDDRHAGGGVTGQTSLHRGMGRLLDEIADHASPIAKPVAGISAAPGDGAEIRVSLPTASGDGAHGFLYQTL